MPPGEQALSREETADEYGRIEQCFYDHLQGPFCFEAQIDNISRDRFPASSHGLVDQPGLSSMLFPYPVIVADTFEDPDGHGQIYLGRHTGPQTPHASCHTILRSSKVPVNELDLGPNTEADLKKLLAQIEFKKRCDIKEQWLPLFSLQDDSDEGQRFPAHTAKVQVLLHREIEKETLSSTDETLAFLDEAILCHDVKKQHRTEPGEWDTQLFQVGYRSVTPPLSPVSDSYGEPFVPDGQTAFIDLTSEPETPDDAKIDGVNQWLVAETLELESTPPSSLIPPFSTPAKVTEVPASQVPRAETLKIDVPLFTSSPDAAESVISPDRQIMLSFLEFPKSETEPDAAETSFQEAMDDIFRGRDLDVGLMVQQERLDPIDSIARVQVPLMDFSISPPEWEDHTLNAATQFSWLLRSAERAVQLCGSRLDSRSDHLLRWTPTPYESSQPSLVENLGELKEKHLRLLSDRPAELFEEAFLTQSKNLMFLEQLTDEELSDVEDGAEPTSGEATSIEVAPSLSSYFASSDSGTASFISDAMLTARRQRIPRKSFGASFNALPTSQDLGATSKLLTEFMELHGCKRVRTESDQDSCRSKKSAKQGANVIPTEDRARVIEQSLRQQRALCPEVQDAGIRGRYLVSISVSRELMRLLMSSWSSEKLIDMDFSSPDGAGLEADILLTPATGVLITHLLQVRQKPLPGSNDKSILRKRISEISAKYETLIVMVAEENPAGEFRGLATSDIEVYADLTMFCASLEANVIPYLVPGAKKTLCAWVVSLMNVYSPENASVSRCLTGKENQWVRILRVAGFNAMAAQVLAYRLAEENGATGMARFLNMSLDERLKRYGCLSGGTKLLRESAKLLDHVRSMT